MIDLSRLPVTISTEARAETEEPPEELLPAASAESVRRWEVSTVHTQRTAFVWAAPSNANRYGAEGGEGGRAMVVRREAERGKTREGVKEKEVTERGGKKEDKLDKFDKRQKRNHRDAGVHGGTNLRTTRRREFGDDLSHACRL